MKLLTIVLLGFSISGYSQDYLITNKGDTLRGDVKILSYDQVDRVQINQNKKKTVTSALQVKVISFNNELYRPIRRDNTIRFMKLLKPGYVSLYAFRLDNQMAYDGRLLAKKDGSTLEVPNLTFRRSVASFLEEDREVREKLESGVYGRKDLDQIIDEFNAHTEAANQALSQATAAESASKQKAGPLEELKSTVEGLDDFSAKKDALDLINDMIAKVKGSQTIPNYQLEALKGYLNGNETTKASLERFLSSVKPN